MDIKEVFNKRKSIRKYNNKEVSLDLLNEIVTLSLNGPSGHGKNSCEVIIVNDKKTLEELSLSRVGSAEMLKGASAALVVISDSLKTTTQIEDSSIVMENMHLLCASNNLGSCWIQIRLREAANGQPSEDYVRNVLGIPANYMVEAILSVGYPDALYEHKAVETALRIHNNKF